jgi:prepilin-type N-terminal cleavage/methylation domain-containing protein
MARPPGVVLSDERGFTLTELLVSIMIFLVVIGGGVALMTTTVRKEPALRERAAFIQQGRYMIERLTREVRQGYGVESATATQLVILTYVKSAECGGPAGTTARACQVTYSCGSGYCTRTERNPDGTGTDEPVRVVRDIVSNSVFSYTPTAAAPSHIGIRLEFPADPGDDAITVEDGVALRNLPGAWQ